MTIDPKGFPLDLSGELARNLVINDTRTLASQDDMVFIPDGGPFYTRSLVIRSGTAILKPNVDYKCLHLLRDATVESGLDVSAIVMITNNSISSVSLNYQVIGGQYADTVPVIRQLLENAGNIEKSVNWNSHIYAKPDLFEPAPHYVKGEDFSDWSAVLNGIRGIERSILLKDVAAWESAFQYMDNLITNRVATINLSNFYTKSQVNAETVKLVLKTSVYTKVETDTRYYNKTEVRALIGDIDGNEAYYTEGEINAKFIETVVADAKYTTKAELNRVDSAKADKSSVYTRIQSDDKYPLSINMYHKDYIDANFVIKGTSYTKAESDLRYALTTDAYTKVDSDKRYALKGQIPTAPDLSKFISRDDADGSYLKITTADVVYLRKTTADSLYAKHTDLEIITTLSRKFANYYTRLETDETFITNTNVNSLFLTKVQGNSLYYTKTYVATTYATKNELTDETTLLVKSVNLKSDTTWVNNTFYDKVESDKRYYTQVDSNNRYHTKQHVDTYFVNNTALASQLALMTTTIKFNDEVLTLRTEINNRFTKAEITSGYYTKSYVDTTLVPVSQYVANNTVLNTAISKKAETVWVDTTFYNKSEADLRYYTKATIDSVIYTKLQSNAMFVASTLFESELNKYTTSVAQNTITARLDSSLNNKYNKNETYSSSEANSRFLLSTIGLLNLDYASTSTYSGGILINNNHATSTSGGSVTWSIRNERSSMIQGTIDTVTNASRLTTWLFDYTARVWTTHAITGTDGMWHRKYGWLHTYFASRGETYTKSEVYSTTESDTRYMTKAQLSTTYTTLVVHAADIGNVNRTLGGKSDTTWVNNTFYDKVESDKRYNTRTEITAGHYTKPETDGMYSTKTALAAEVAKLATTLSLNANILSVKNMFAGYYTKIDIDRSYATIAKLNLKADVTWSNNTFYDKVESDLRYYTKAQSDLNYAPRIDTDNRLKALSVQVTNLISRIEAYKVGDIFITTTNFSSSAAVGIHHGYGTWVRYSQGRTLVGFSSNGWTDEISANKAVDYDSSLFTNRMGYGFGEYQHKLLINEIPNHTHNLGFKLRTNIDVDWGGRDSGIDSTGSLTGATGGDAPHNNVQPSMVVGMWKRAS